MGIRCNNMTDVFLAPIPNLSENFGQDALEGAGLEAPRVPPPVAGQLDQGEITPAGEEQASQDYQLYGV